ncbi:MAG: exodeoxyribonuclease VII small subunit [Chitinispirillales bacterium]|jgi:exodeoxyribonuclease VII small subunit|nr:exodeoxyribonuclease VII small subunit [Chitinispirillales bacterium]
MATAKSKAAQGADGSAPTFESALSELEGIIERLEGSDLTLDSALGHFEEGVRLMRFCDAHLKSAKGRLLELTRGEDGKLVTAILGEGLDSFTDGTEDGDG